MIRPIQAIFERGVFRPLEPVALTDRQVVRLSIEPSEVNDSLLSVEQRQTAWKDFVTQMEALPEPGEASADLDHDREIYDDSP